MPSSAVVAWYFHAWLWECQVSWYSYAWLWVRQVSWYSYAWQWVCQVSWYSYAWVWVCQVWYSYTWLWVTLSLSSVVVFLRLAAVCVDSSASRHTVSRGLEAVEDKLSSEALRKLFSRTKRDLGLGRGLRPVGLGNGAKRQVAPPCTAPPGGRGTPTPEQIRIVTSSSQKLFLRITAAMLSWFTELPSGLLQWNFLENRNFKS